MRLAMFFVSGAVVVAALASPRDARADDGDHKELWGTLGVDTTFRAAADGPRGDLAYNYLTTVRAHFGLGPHASLSMGMGLPVLQLFVGGFAASGNERPDNVVAALTSGIGVATPVRLRFTPGRRSEGGVMLEAGATPVLETAIVCALGGTCEGRKSLALVLGYAVSAGVGWQWKGGSFVSLAYSAGHLWPGGHAGGVDALEGRYIGGMLSFGVAFGR